MAAMNCFIYEIKQPNYGLYMPNIIEVSSLPIIGWSGGIPTFSMTGSESSILWKIAEKSTFEIYSLQHLEFHYPETKAKGSWVSGNVKAFAKKAKTPRTYHLSFIKKVIRSLTKKGFVEVSSNPTQDRMKKNVAITLPGLIYYLQHTGLEETNLNRVLNHHSRKLPFLKYWNNLTNDQRAYCHEALFRTVQTFNEIEKVEFLVKPFNFRFTGYLESREKLAEKESANLNGNLRDNTIIDLLRKTEELKNAYIAYLIAMDIHVFSTIESKDIQYNLPKLKAQSELSFLDGTQNKDANLPYSEAIKNFVPKFSTIEYFFTGLLIYNLLWRKLKDSETERKEFDFEVRYFS
jgi:hypothetical protein